MYCRVIQLYENGQRIDICRLRTAPRAYGRLNVKPIRVNGFVRLATTIMSQNFVGNWHPALPPLLDAAWDRTSQRGFVLRGWQFEERNNNFEQERTTEIVQEWWVLPLREPKVGPGGQTVMDTDFIASVIRENHELLDLLLKLREFAEQARGVVAEQAPEDPDLVQYGQAIDCVDELLALAVERRASKHGL